LINKVSETKNTKTAINLPLFVGLALAAGIIIGAQFSKPKLDSTETVMRNTLKLREVLFYLDREYVDSVNTDDLVEKAISGLLQNLDPHSSYLPPKNAELATASLQGTFDGIGVEFNMIRDTLTIMGVIPNGPSEKAGILLGDKIITVNDELIAGVKLPNQKIVETLRGPRGSSVYVGLLRKNEPELLSISIQRDKIPQKSVDVHYMVNDEIGYVKISTFGAATSEEFRIALSDLKSRGMTKLMVDLQGNPGGYVSAAEAIADELLGSSMMIVAQKGKLERFDKNTYAIKDGLFEEGPLVILVDEYSASASEILAGAIQDNDRGLIVGRRSFGKGLVQRPIKLADQSELRLTIARYYTPSGRSIQRSYENGRTAYSQDISNRLSNGEFFQSDSSLLEGKPKFETLKGRPVYGGGGILPDYFVALDTSQNSSYLNRLIASQVMRELAFEVVEERGPALKNMEFRDFDRNFKVDAILMNKLLQMANKQNVEFSQSDFDKSQNKIADYLKAFIAKNIYGDAGFYPIINNMDEVYNIGLTLFEEAGVLAEK